MARFAGRILGGGSRVQVVCPHCANPVAVERISPGEVFCAACGSSFRLAGESTAAYAGDGPRRLGKFELLEELGRGAFGTVYKARDPELDRVVAVKVPRAGELTGGEALDRFVREARSVARLRHPGLVPVYEVGQAERVPYLVSEFVRGVTLVDLLSARRPTAREAAEIVAAVADALQYAHREGVVHRDVKPSNILLEEASGGREPPEERSGSS